MREVEDEEVGLGRDQEAVAVDPACGGDDAVEGPVAGLVAFAGQEAVAEDVEPEELAAFGVPERAFAKVAGGVVVRWS